MGLTLKLAALAWALGWASLASVHAETVVVPLPCDEASPPRPGLRTCAELLDDQPGKPGLLTNFKQRILVQIDGNDKVGGYYQNIDPDAKLPPVSTDLAPLGKNTPGNYFGPAVCNLVPGDLTGNVSETRVDHHSRSCGQPSQLNVKVNSSATSFSAEVTPRAAWSPDATRAPGSLEDGYTKGALVAATQCFYSAMKNEIRNKHQITISEVSGHTSPCLALAQDASQQTSRLNLMSKNLASVKERLVNQPANIADIVNCEKIGLDPAALQIGARPDVQGLRQSAQQLCAARAAMEAVATQLAACQVFAQSSSAWSRALREKDGVDAFAAHFKKEILEPCRDGCRKKLDAEFDMIDRPSASDISSCADRCYRGDLPSPQGKDDGRLVPAVRKYFEGLWPANPSSAQGCRFGALPMGLFFVGSLGGSLGALPFRRRRRWLAAVGWGLVAFKLAACSDDPAATTIPQMPTDVADPCGAPPSFADAQARQTFQSQRSKICTPHTPGRGGMGGAIEGGAAAASSGQASLDSAQRLEDPAGHDQVNTGGMLAQGAAASDNVTSAPKATGLATGGSDNKALSKPIAGGSRGTGGGGGAPAGGGSGIGGELKTAALAGAPVGGPAPGGADGAGSEYKSTGGAGDAGGGAGGESGSRFSFGGGAGADGSGPASEITIGADAGAMGAAPLGSEDPEDYFTRTGLGDSLFKKVEKVYRSKSMVWATVR